MAVDAKYKVTGDILRSLYNFQYRMNPCEKLSVDITKSYINSLACVDENNIPITGRYCGNFSCPSTDRYTISHFIVREIKYEIVTDVPEYDIILKFLTSDVIGGESPLSITWEIYDNDYQISIVGSSITPVLNLKVTQGWTPYTVVFYMDLTIVDARMFTYKKRITFVDGHISEINPIS